MCSIRIMFFLLDFNTIRWIVPDQQTVKTLVTQNYVFILADHQSSLIDQHLAATYPFHFQGTSKSILTFSLTASTFWVIFFVNKIMKLGIKSCCSSSKAVFPEF